MLPIPLYFSSTCHTKTIFTIQSIADWSFFSEYPVLNSHYESKMSLYTLCYEHSNTTTEQQVCKAFWTHCGSHYTSQRMLKFLQPSLKTQSPSIPWVGAGKAAEVWITLSRAARTQSGKTPAGVTRPNLSLCIIHASFTTFFGRQLVGRKWFPINSGPLTETAGVAPNPDRRWPLCSPHAVMAGRMTVLNMRQC